jgi:peroxiredoxin
MKRRIALGLSALAAVILPVPELLPEEKAPPRTPVEAGKPAPDFTLRDESGKDIKLSSFAGRKSVLLAFYAKDFTPGCTSELRGLRAEHDALEKAGVQVLGISVDPVESHGKFRAELELPFPLLSDEGGKVSSLYGVLGKSPSGQPISKRSVFLVDRDGIVRHGDTEYDLKTADDHDALLEAVTALGKKKPAAAKLRPPRLEGLVFGRITVEGREQTDDVVIDRGKTRSRDKGPSKSRRDEFGHTPLTPAEKIPWDCKVLLIGTGMDGQLPVTEELKAEAKRRGVKLILRKTPEALEYLKEHYDEGMNAILHITC